MFVCGFFLSIVIFFIYCELFPILTHVLPVMADGPAFSLKSVLNLFFFLRAKNVYLYDIFTILLFLLQLLLYNFHHLQTKTRIYCFNFVNGKLNTKNYYLYVRKISKIQYQLCLTSFISLDYILSIVRLE